MSIDFDKPVQTRDGRKVWIYTTEGRHPTEPVVGEIYGGSICPPILSRWCADGGDSKHSVAGYDRPTPNDLVNVPQQRAVWINAYKSYTDHQPVRLHTHDSKAQADESARDDRIACIEVTFTEGEGLE